VIKRYWPIPILLPTLLWSCAGESRPAPVEVPVPVFEPSGGAPPAPLTLEDPGSALVPLYRALAAAEAQAPGARVVISQFGDSHTAGDRLTGALRQELQARFGDAGRGFVLTGRPRDVKWYELIDVRYGTEGAWKSDQGGVRGTTEPYGLGATRSYATKKTAEAWVATCPDCDAGQAVARFEVFFLRQPDGGVLQARVDDGSWIAIPTEGEAAAPDYFSIDVPDGDHTLTLRPKGGAEVDVFGIALERDQPGVIVEALGVVGRQLAHLWKWDWTVIGPQLAHRAPSLVVLQYGTNEAGDEDFDVVKFEERYVEVIGRVQAAVPDAAILVLGPPDLAERELGKKACEKATAKAQKAWQKAAKAARKKRRAAPPEPGIPEGCSWTTPVVLADIIAAERRAAQRTGVAFFDTFAAMGGAGVMDPMVQADPALAYGDHVHYTGKGYTFWADLLREDLMRGYAAWQKLGASRRSSSRSPP